MNSMFDENQFLVNVINEMQERFTTGHFCGGLL